MVSVQGTDVCPNCGEEYWYNFDCTTLEYTKLTACACDRFMCDAEEFLKNKGLWEEFLKFHEEREREYRKTKKEWGLDDEEEGGEG
jgi:nuclear transport factor 2 (NTF2) superfamily protein